MIEIYLLEQLLAFHKYGTLSAASEKLHLAQPSLSRSMQKLESILDVKLFNRQKNRITLNENGILAAEYAARIIEMERDMTERIRAFDRSRNTITIASCAPAPLFILPTVLSQTYSEMTIASAIKNEEKLIRGLLDDTYQIIVLTHPLEDDTYYNQQWRDEHLYITLPPAHPLSVRKGLYLHEMNGQSMLLYSQIGFWYDLCTAKMPDSHFLIQNEYQSLEELILASALPAFTTDIVRRDDIDKKNRVAIPVLDPEANVTFHCICKQSEKQRLTSFWRQTALTND